MERAVASRESVGSRVRVDGDQRSESCAVIRIEAVYGPGNLELERRLDDELGGAEAQPRLKVHPDHDEFSVIEGEVPFDFVSAVRSIALDHALSMAYRSCEGMPDQVWCPSYDASSITTRVWPSRRMASLSIGSAATRAELMDRERARSRPTHATEPLEQRDMPGRASDRRAGFDLNR